MSALAQIKKAVGWEIDKGNSRYRPSSHVRIGCVVVAEAAAVRPLPGTLPLRTVAWAECD